ncbi:MAG: hypothetical protein FWG27_08145 [Treponema sp.]|nr:hypothetical protein [Treponema sp.]
MRIKLFLIASLLFCSIFSGCKNPWMEKILDPLFKDQDDIFYVGSQEEWEYAQFAIGERGGNKSYRIILTNNFETPGIIVDGFTFTFSSDAVPITVTIIGRGKTIGLKSAETGSLLSIAGEQTVVLQNVNLQGHSSNNTPLVYVEGAFTMNGGSISGNTANDGGVYVVGSGIFTMNSGIISGNTANSGGGGVYVHGSNTTFTMNGGSISGNTVTGSNSGGGVCVMSGATSTMNGGTISGNTSTGNVTTSGGGVYVNTGTFTMNSGSISGNTVTGSNSGGGVCVMSGATSTMNGGTISGNTSTGNVTTSGGGVYVNTGTFTMNSGSISGNSTNNNGGGVHMNTGTFTMNNGTISGNTANNRGAGVYGDNNATFTITGGAVYGMDSQPPLGNMIAPPANPSGNGTALYVVSGTVTIFGFPHLAPHTEDNTLSPP